MRKLLMMMVMMVAAAGMVRAEGTGSGERGVAPVYQARTLNALQIDSVANSTVTVMASSMTVVIGGVTSTYVFATSTTNTLGEIAALIDAQDNVTCTVVQGMYIDNPSTELSVASKAIDTGHTLTVDNTLGISYVQSADSNRSHYVSDITANATFSEGTCYLNIYDGDSITDTQLRHEQIKTSGTEMNSNINRWLFGSDGSAQRYDVVSSTWISAGYLNKTGFKK